VIFFFFSQFFSVQSFTETNSEWNSDWKFQQEIIIPIDTSLVNAKFQAIDISVSFENDCWAINELTHSIRVVCFDENIYHELESQIYDLNFIEQDIIDQCNLVFLVPEFADGNEKYFLVYDDSKKTAPEYTDHITIQDDYFLYEPIPGQKVETNYYRIEEDGYIIFGVSQKGRLIQDKISQVVVKFKPNTKEFNSYSIEQFAAFQIIYHTDRNWEKYFGTSFSKDIEKRILIDGNLMGRVQIKCIDPRGELKTNNIYTYYYNPSQNKKIFTNVNHEVLKEIIVSSDKVVEGSIANLLSFKSRSANIKSFNIGDILPYVHVYEEDEVIRCYPVPENPLSTEKEMVLGTEDDVDLGSKAWFTMDNPKTGKAYGLIFSSTNNIFNFEDNGIQVKAYSKEEVNLPVTTAATGMFDSEKSN
jgi:hypothetical protein